MSTEQKKRPKALSEREGISRKQKLPAVRYCRGRSIPMDPQPEGFFLVHNRGAPCSAGALSGFRAWVQEGRSNLVRCHCDFGGLESTAGVPIKKAEVPKHYRIRDSILRKNGWTD
jgi:hypothetical protein